MNRHRVVGVVLAGLALAAGGTTLAAAAPSADVPAAVPAASPVGAIGQQDPFTPPGATVLIFAARGTGQNISDDPSRTQFEVPLYDVTTGAEIGRSTHDFICNGALTCEDNDTYFLPEGTLRVTSDVGIGPDTQRPGAVIAGAHPVEHQLDGTGDFEGRTGMVRIHGFDDVSTFPFAITLDEIYIVTYW